MKKFPVKAVCRAGIIAALYAVLTIYLGSIAYGPFQIRPAEALTLLPLLYAESIPALFVGCLIANLVSPYGVPDIVVGSLITLVAACLTYIIPRFVKNRFLRAGIGGIFPVFLNAIILPIMWLIMGGMGSFWYNLLSMSCTQLVWVYVLGGPLYFLKSLQNTLSYYLYFRHQQQAIQNFSHFALLMIDTIYLKYLPYCRQV